ncbi:MAG: DUF6798 domain-containing protein [Planctomycetota bacterium]
MLTTRSRAYVWPTLLLLGAGYALANGLGYACGNLRQYLLHGLHGLDPGFLAADWFTTQTRAHHAAFNLAVVITGEVMRLDVAFAVANAIFGTVFVVCIYELAARYYRRPIVVAALAVFIYYFTSREMIGWSAITSAYFQPSTIGAVGMLAGLVCLIRRRYRTAGMVLFVAALFHVNYMVWIVAVVGVVVLLNAKRLGRRSVMYLVAPVSVAAVYHLPFLLEGRLGEQAAYVTQASWILHDVYMPCHSRPLTWGAEPFVRFACLVSAGLLAASFVKPAWRHDPLARSILATLIGIVGVGLALTTVVQVDTVALLFPYRLAPFLVLAADLAVAGAVVTTSQLRVLALWRTLLLWGVLAVLLWGGGFGTYGLLCVGVFAVALLTTRLARERNVSFAVMAMAIVGLAFLLHCCGAGLGSLAFVGLFGAGAMCWRLVRGTVKHLRRRPGMLLASGVAVPLAVGVLLMRIGSTRKDLLGPPPSVDEQLLYAWCNGRTASEDAFILPPILGGFRLGAQRAVVVDWKCMPILPEDTVEWYRRLAAVCGGEFATLGEANAGYTELDTARAALLARRYHARYVITYGAQHEGDLSALACVYRNPTFAVYDVPPLQRLDKAVVDAGDDCGEH